MSLRAAADIPVLVTSANSSSERRVSPSWSIAHFKSRLEPITGIPSHLQQLRLKLGGSGQEPIPIEATDEASTQLGTWPLQAYAEISVTSAGPASATPNYTDVSTVQKFELPADEYAKRGGTVLDYKRQHGIGRFDPSIPTAAATAIASAEQYLTSHNLAVNSRVRLLPKGVDDRKGRILYIGPVPELPGLQGVPWIGVALDEPTGKNDGSVAVSVGSEDGKDSGGPSETGGRRRYFDAGGEKRGAFVRAEKAELLSKEDEDDEDRELKELMDDAEDEMEEI